MNALNQFLFPYVFQNWVVLVISSSFKKLGTHTPTKSFLQNKIHTMNQDFLKFSVVKWQLLVDFSGIIMSKFELIRRGYVENFAPTISAHYRSLFWSTCSSFHPFIDVGIHMHVKNINISKVLIFKYNGYK